MRYECCIAMRKSEGECGASSNKRHGWTSETIALRYPVFFGTFLKAGLASPFTE
jgi:hypothetical protein